MVPLGVMSETRLVAKETNATYVPSGLITGLKLGPLPADWPSAEIEMSCGTELVEVVAVQSVVVDAIQMGRQ